MLIFDSFPSLEKAREFAEEVTSKTRLGSTVYTTEEEAQEADPFPYVLQPPIVHIERSTLRRERRIARFVKRFGGQFAGT